VQESIGLRLPTRLLPAKAIPGPSFHIFRAMHVTPVIPASASVHEDPSVLDAPQSGT